MYRRGKTAAAPRSRQRAFEGRVLKLTVCIHGGFKEALDAGISPHAGFPSRFLADYYLVEKRLAAQSLSL